MSGKLTLGEDVGGPRHFLDGRPVNCGAGLEMKVPAEIIDHLTGEKWVPVRYEADLYPGHIRVYLYAYPWSASRPHKAKPGTEVVGRAYCERCEERFYKDFPEDCPELEWGPTVIVAVEGQHSFEDIPDVTLRWPVRK